MNSKMSRAEKKRICKNCGEENQNLMKTDRLQCKLCFSKQNRGIIASTKVKTAVVETAPSTKVKTEVVETVSLVKVKPVVVETVRNEELLNKYNWFFKWLDNHDTERFQHLFNDIDTFFEIHREERTTAISIDKSMSFLREKFEICQTGLNKVEITVKKLTDDVDRIIKNDTSVIEDIDNRTSENENKIEEFDRIIENLNADNLKLTEITKTLTDENKALKEQLDKYNKSFKLLAGRVAKMENPEVKVVDETAVKTK
jgi:hypothetical protein